jgi:hypothetical protein
MQAALSATASEPTLLQRCMPEVGTPMVALEGAKEISDDEVRQSEAD